MANLSNTSPWIGAGQGISRGIRDVGAIQGMVQQRNAAQQEAELYPLKRKALERQGAIQDIQFQEAKRMAQPRYVDDMLGKLQSHPNTKAFYEEALTPFLQKDAAGRPYIIEKDYHELYKMFQTESWQKKLTTAKITDLNEQILALAPQKSETGEMVAENPLERTQKDLKIQLLKQKQAELKKTIGLMPKIKQWAKKEDGSWLPLDEHGQVIEELADKKLTPDSAIDKSPSDMELYLKGTPEERAAMERFKGAGQAPKEAWGPETEGPGGTKRQVSGTGKISTTYKPPTSETKPEYTPKQAMARISAIDMAIAKMKTTGILDAAIAQNPLFKDLGLGESRDPEAVSQAIASLEAEREEILKYVPKGYGAKPEKPKATPKTENIIRYDAKGNRIK
ncbi:MAG: hypothetical protein A2169_07965 [Deltaproteobacteria bacterium RBG_13_47_9]|nr:MAG: hypothetical protein A2169_07965 [Deltaproteobacteria bacterium RBG_13_47_9]